MSIAIIDAREWQNVFDLHTSDKVEDTSPCVNMVKGVLARHHYPGDTDASCNAWVTDTALDLIKEYEPRFVWLIYAHQFLNCRHIKMTAQEREAMFAAAAEEINRFIDESGFTPVIIGSGTLTPVERYADIGRLDGLVSVVQSLHFGGIHEPSAADLDMLRHSPDIARLVSKDDFRSLFPEAECDTDRLPDYLFEAKPEVGFKSAGGFERQILEVNSTCRFVPVSSHIGNVSDIRQIRSLIEGGLKSQKIALIIAEGFGEREFVWPYSMAANGREWFFYETGDGQYLTISAGAHRPFDFPVGYRHIDEAINSTEYPLSGYFLSMPQGMICEGFEDKSIAVGNRSMLTHTIPMADVSIECFARNMYNQGTLGVIHRKNKL